METQRIQLDVDDRVPLVAIREIAAEWLARRQMIIDEFRIEYENPKNPRQMRINLLCNGSAGAVKVGSDLQNALGPLLKAREAKIGSDSGAVAFAETLVRLVFQPVSPSHETVEEKDVNLLDVFRLVRHALYEGAVLADLHKPLNFHFNVAGKSLTPESVRDVVLELEMAGLVERLEKTRAFYGLTDWGKRLALVVARPG